MVPTRPPNHSRESARACALLPIEQACQVSRNLLLSLVAVGELRLDLLKQADNPLVRRRLLALTGPRHLLPRIGRPDSTPDETRLQTLWRVGCLKVER
jgi:hypothetical protein